MFPKKCRWFLYYNTTSEHSEYPSLHLAANFTQTGDSQHLYIFINLLLQAQVVPSMLK